MKKMFRVSKIEFFFFFFNILLMKKMLSILIIKSYFWAEMCIIDNYVSEFTPSSPMSLQSHFNQREGPPHPPSPLQFPGMSSALTLTPPHHSKPLSYTIKTNRTVLSTQKFFRTLTKNKTLTKISRNIEKSQYNRRVCAESISLNYQHWLLQLFHSHILERLY